MKLIGSLTEGQYRAELISSRDAIFSDNKSPALLQVLQAKFPENRSALVLYWTPEQSEDIYDILIDANSVAVVEISKDGGDSLVELMSFEEYSMRIKSKQRHIKMTVALDLLKISPSDKPLPI